MNSDMILNLGRRALETTLLVSAPVLAVALTVGFLTAMLQTVTSIRDMTMGLVLKLACIGATILVFGGWMMQVAASFTMEIFNQIATIGH